jgi:hypothetical protein
VTFGRRITLYLFGFTLGGIIVWFGLMKDRPDDALTSWLPTKRIIMQLDTNKLKLTPILSCRLHCIGTDSAEIKSLIKHGEVNFSKSEVHATPYPRYAVDATSKNGRHLRMIFTAVPAETQLLSVADLGMKTDSCGCK